MDSPHAETLVGLTAAFEDLQTVLRCCERLVAELSVAGGPDDVVVEAVWTTALLSYARCFTDGASTAMLNEDDLTTLQPNDDILSWHKVLFQLRDHYADPATNPREQFLVGVAQDVDGAANGVAITSTRQPLVDDLTVRQTGAIAFSLSNLVNDRIAAAQQVVFDDLEDATPADLNQLDQLEVAQPDAPA